MTDINIGAITEALNDKSDRDLRNVDTTAKADAVIDFQLPTAENNYTWYRKYKSGWVEQGGFIPTASPYGRQTYSLPVAMADTNYTAIVSVSGYDATTAISYRQGGSFNRTTTSIDIYNDNSVEKNWQVSGMAA